MLLVKEKEVPGGEPSNKRAKYEDGICHKEFKNNGVRKIQVIGCLVKVQESYENLKLMLEELDLTGVDATLCADIKLLLTNEGKQGASSKHNCYLCLGQTPWIGEVPLMTIGDLRDNHQAYVENGEQKADASKYLNVVNKPLVVGDDHELLIDKMGIPELHVLTGSI